MKKILFSIIISFSTSIVFGQNNDYKKEISENKFSSIKKRKIPIEIIKQFGCDSYNKVGTKRTQTGCTSGKKIVINWAVTDKNGLYILSVSTCGAYSHKSCYIVSNMGKYDTHMSQPIDSFADFRKIYLK